MLSSTVDIVGGATVGQVVYTHLTTMAIDERRHVRLFTRFVETLIAPPTVTVRALKKYVSRYRIADS